MIPVSPHTQRKFWDTLKQESETNCIVTVRSEPHIYYDTFDETIIQQLNPYGTIYFQGRHIQVLERRYWHNISNLIEFHKFQIDPNYTSPQFLIVETDWEYQNRDGNTHSWDTIGGLIDLCVQNDAYYDYMKGYNYEYYQKLMNLRSSTISCRDLDRNLDINKGFSSKMKEVIRQLYDSITLFEYHARFIPRLEFTPTPTSLSSPNEHIILPCTKSEDEWLKCKQQAYPTSNIEVCSEKIRITYHHIDAIATRTYQIV